MKPTIAISCVLRPSPSDSVWYRLRENFVNEAYVTQLNKAGALPYLLPYLQESDLGAQIAPFDALLVPGGADFDAHYYHEEDMACTVPPDALMDSYQLQLIRTARALGKWVFGVCRGFQGINIALGGTLYQDISTQRPQSLVHMQKESPYAPVHQVSLRVGSHLQRAFGSTEIAVNSLHHQGIKTLATALCATAHAEDGLIEGFEAEKILAVQWHPEVLDSPFFDYLVSLLR